MDWKLSLKQIALADIQKIIKTPQKGLSLAIQAVASKARFKIQGGLIIRVMSILVMCIFGDRLLHVSAQVNVAPSELIATTALFMIFLISLYYFIFPEPYIDKPLKPSL